MYNTRNSLEKNETRLLDERDTGPDEEHNVDHADKWVQVRGVVLRDHLVVDQAGSQEGEHTPTEVSGNIRHAGLLHETAASRICLFWSGMLPVWFALPDCSALLVAVATNYKE